MNLDPRTSSRHTAASRAYASHAEPSGDQSRRDDLVTRYAPMVRFVANRLAMRLPPQVSVDDLISAGILGLIDAIEKYDASRGVKFGTYAEFRVRGAMIDELRHMDWVPRSVRKKVQDIEKAVMAVETRESRPAEAEEIAAELGMDMVEYQDFLSRAAGIELVSMDQALAGSNDKGRAERTVGDLVSDHTDPATTLFETEHKKILANAIRSLTSREQTVLSLYYFEELTLREVGEVLGVTESRICQIHTQCIIKLRARLGVEARKRKRASNR